VIAGVLSDTSSDLDEKGNHLDVDTVEALVDALWSTRGLGLHQPRSALTRPASTRRCVMRVRTGRVTNYIAVR